MDWKQTGPMSAESDCGNYRITGGLHDHGNIYVATRLTDGKMIVASSDKKFVKYRCEADASQQEASCTQKSKPLPN